MGGQVHELHVVLAVRGLQVRAVVEVKTALVLVVVEVVAIVDALGADGGHQAAALDQLEHAVLAELELGEHLAALVLVRQDVGVSEAVDRARFEAEGRATEAAAQEAAHVALCELRGLVACADRHLDQSLGGEALGHDRLERRGQLLHVVLEGVLLAGCELAARL